MNTKKIIAITTIALAGTSLSHAQADIQNVQNENKNFGERMMQSLTEAQKNILDQAKKLFESGKQAEAKTLLDQNSLKGPGKGMKGGHPGKMGGDRKAIEDAIIAGNFTQFQTLASTSPLKSLSLENFNLLTPQFKAKLAAEENIKNILKTAGIAVPEKGMRPHGGNNIK